ncbi:MAG: hypothetical protein UR12_C0042G0008 [candidate division TM6 bacterium GW2011_GWF2_30_66]|nr:MAG: hypothetical protein UR12_C0042G0008 [candidate division TM6 bacterium GW2011_GWF2_30_66]
MKKILLSSVLLLSCVVKAESTTDNISPENITFENSVCQETMCENSPQENIIRGKVSKTIKTNIETISENCDSIILTFKINKNKNISNKQEWQDAVSAISDLIDFAENSINRSEEDISNVLTKSYNFLKDCSKSPACIGDYSINLNIPEDFAKTLFSN